MAVVGELLVLIGANNTALTAGLAKSEAELKGFSATGTSALAGLGTVGLALTAGIAVFGGAAVRSASQFQSSMELIHTQAGASQAEVDSLTKSVLALGPAVGTSPQVLADALFHIESAGLRGAAALKVLTAAAQGAKVGHADLETVTNALVAAQFSQVKGTTDMVGTMGALNAIVGAGNMRMQDLASSFSSGILPAARTFGLSITDVGAALATMTDQGVPAEEAATRLRMTFALLGAPTTKAAKELHSIGLTHNQLADDMRKPNGLMVALTDLEAHLKSSGLTATEQAQVISGAFGGGRSAGTVETLLNRLDLVKSKYEAIGAGSGQFGEAFAKTSAEASFGFAKLGASIEVVVDSVGLGLLPIVSQVLAVVNPLVAQFAAWASANQETAATILLVAGGIGALLASVLVLGPVLEAVAIVIGIITSPILLAIGAIVLLAAHFNLLGNDAKNAVEGVTVHLSKLIPATGPLRLIFEAVGAAIKAIPDALALAQSAISGFISAASGIATAIGPTVVGAAQTAFAGLSGAIGTVSGAIAGFVSNAGNQQAALTAIGRGADIARVALGMIGDAIRTVVTAITSFVTSASNQRTALTLIGQAADGARAAIGFVSSAIGVVVGWISTFISHLTGAGNGARNTGTAVSSVGAALVAVGSVIATVVVAIAGFVARMVDGAQKAGVFKIAGDAITLMFGLLGDALRITFTLAGNLAGVVSGILTIAFNAIKGVIDGITSAIRAAIGAIQSMIDLAGKAVAAVAAIPGVKLGGDIAGNVAGAAGNIVGGIAGAIPQWASGGTVPGSGPQLAIVHGGETITPAGRRNAQPIHLHHTTVLQVDGKTIGQIVEELLFNSGSAFSSGYAGSPVTE